MTEERFKTIIEVNSRMEKTKNSLKNIERFINDLRVSDIENIRVDVLFSTKEDLDKLNNSMYECLKHNLEIERRRLLELLQILEIRFSDL